MNRYLAACLLVLAGIVAVLPRVHAQPSPQAGTVTVIDGRLHPESVPAPLGWEHFFDDMVMVGFDTPYDVDPRPEIIEPLSKYNLLIPEAQVRTVLLVSKATIDKINALKRPLDPKGD